MIRAIDIDKNGIWLLATVTKLVSSVNFIAIKLFILNSDLYAMF